MYPELDSLSLTELEARFRAAPPEDPDLEDAAPPEDPELEYDDLWYDEVAIAIRERDPDEGARFLRGEVAGADFLTNVTPRRRPAVLWSRSQEGHTKAPGDHVGLAEPLVVHAVQRERTSADLLAST